MNIFSFIFCAPETTFFLNRYNVFFISSIIVSHHHRRRRHCFFFHKIRQKKAAELLLLKKYINACFNFFWSFFLFVFMIYKKKEPYVCVKKRLIVALIFDLLVNFIQLDNLFKNIIVF